jgi:type I restriction enzyme S subunit
MAELVSSATGAAQQHVNKANFEELVISIPAAEGDRLLQNIPDLLGKVDALAHENVTLSLLRNTLLPELLSGRLRVKDAESMMENV